MSCSPSQKNNSLMFSSRHYYLLHNILWLNIYNININIYMQWIKLFFIVWLILKAQLQRLLQTKLTLLTVSFVSVFNFQPHWEISENNMAFDQPTMIGTEIWNILTRNFYWWKKGNHFLDYFWRNTTMQQYTENFQHMVGWCPLLDSPLKNNFFQNPDMEDDDNPHLPHPLAVSPSSLPEEVEEVDFHRFHSTLVWQGLS